MVEAGLVPLCVEKLVQEDSTQLKVSPATAAERLPPLDYPVTSSPSCTHSLTD